MFENWVKKKAYARKPLGSLIDIYKGFAGPQRRGVGMGSKEYKVWVAKL